MNDNTPWVIGFISVIMIMIGMFSIGYHSGVDSVCKDAIKVGVGKYIADSNGEVRFEWIKK